MILLLGAVAASRGAFAGNLLLADPEFDGGIGAWMVGAAQSTAATEDANACPLSFALHGEATGGGSPSIVRATGSDCIPVQPGDELFLEISYRSERPLYLYLILYAGSGCTTPLLGDFGPAFPALVNWNVARRAITINPSNVTGVRFSALAMDDPGPSSFIAELDRAFLGHAPRIFGDDFEGGATCRWSNAS